VATSSEFGSAVYVELWVSFASLLRSYTAARGLNGKRQATVELGEERILVRDGDDWLDLRQSGAKVNSQREDGRAGMPEFTEAGRKLILKAYQERKQESLQHPLLDQQLRIGQMPGIQARILARHLRGDIADYVPLVPK